MPEQDVALQANKLRVILNCQMQRNMVKQRKRKQMYERSRSCEQPPEQDEVREKEK